MESTGYLDSAIDLGINAPEQDRMLYRRTTDCAVLSTQDRTQSKMNPDAKGTANPYENITYFYYGKDESDGYNYTYAASNYTEDYYDFWYDVT